MVAPAWPPKSTSRWLPGAVTKDAPIRAGGLRMGRIERGIDVDHVVPVHSHVSPRGAPSAPLPPKRTDVSVLGSKPKAASVRARGEVAGDCCDQVVPSHVQVSATLADPVLPPKRTTSPRTASKVAAAALRAGGDVGGDSCDQVLPSHVQVSPSGEPVADTPPKSTSLPATESATIDAWSRAGGEVAGVSGAHVVPSHDQVAPLAVPSAATPPNRMIWWPMLSYAIDADASGGGGRRESCNVQVEPSHVQVSSRIWVPDWPPNSTVVPVAASKAEAAFSWRRRGRAGREPGPGQQGAGGGRPGRGDAEESGGRAAPSGARRVRARPSASFSSGCCARVGSTRLLVGVGVNGT